MYTSRSRFQGCEGSPAVISATSPVGSPPRAQPVRTSPAPSGGKVAPMAGIYSLVRCSGCCCCSCVCLCACVCALRRRFTLLSHGFHGKSRFASALRKIPTRRERARAGGLNHLAQTAGFADAAGRISQHNRVIAHWENESAGGSSCTLSRQMGAAVRQGRMRVQGEQTAVTRSA